MHSYQIMNLFLLITFVSLKRCGKTTFLGGPKELFKMYKGSSNYCWKYEKHERTFAIYGGLVENRGWREILDTNTIYKVRWRGDS